LCFSIGCLLDEFRERFLQLHRIGERDVPDRHEVIEIPQQRRFDRRLFPDRKEDRYLLSAEDVVGELEGAALADAGPDDDHRVRLFQQLEARGPETSRGERQPGSQREPGAKRLVRFRASASQQPQRMRAAIELPQHVEYTLNDGSFSCVRPGERLPDEYSQGACGG
jgi:hypothetical protein